MNNALMAIFTGIIAVATVAYVIVTCRLLKATKKSADAAKLTAEAAKRSADTDAAVHRPYLGVSELKRHNEWNAVMWAIRCCIRNYGTLPASKVKVDIAVGQNPGDTFYGGGSICNDAEILPQAELTGFLNIRVEKSTHALLSNGQAMIARITVRYRAPDGGPRVHTAMFSYDMATQNFKVDGSETKEGQT